MTETIPRFSNHLPVRIQFGEGVASNLATVLRAESASRALVLVDEGLEELNGPVAGCLTEVGSQGVEIVRWLKEPGEPTFDVVEGAAEAITASGATAVVAIGGGSVMDTAKAARVCVEQDVRIDSFTEAAGPFGPPTLPLVCLPTTAGTGSEVTGGAVLADPRTGVKAGIANPLLRAQHALVDPELTYSLPPDVTAYTGIDALAQAIAAVVVKARTPIGNAIALEAVRLAARALPLVVADGRDRVARSDMCCASMMAGLAMNISDAGAEHSLAQALGGQLRLPHGLTVGLVLAETLEREREYVPELFEGVADALGAPDDGSRDGSRAISAVRRILAAIGIPVLTDFGVTQTDLEGLADAAMKDFFITLAPEPWTREDVRSAYEAALALPRRETGASV